MTKCQLSFTTMGLVLAITALALATVGHPESQVNIAKSMAASFVQPNLHPPRNYEILVLNLRFQTLDAFCGGTTGLDKTRVIKDEKRCAPARRFSPNFGFASDFTRGCQSPGRCTRQRPIRSLIFRARCESCRLLAQFLELSPRSPWEWPLGSDCLPLSPRRSR